ncbi:unnamed protein product [Clonostachys chloroleuca]|uniref:Uncharacterized protein n=1 Tax=Clonostachys chloroleuca TaxID=1926264 RepID=A0AA35PZ10_9HYPO|nr:unnamed protein product [Clonostachys chloroleuca]
MDAIFETAFAQLGHPPGSIGGALLPNSSQQLGAQAMINTVSRFMNVPQTPDHVTAELLGSILVERYFIEYADFIPPSVANEHRFLTNRAATLSNEAYQTPASLRSWWGSMIRSVQEEAAPLGALIRLMADGEFTPEVGIFRDMMSSTRHFVLAAATCGEHDWAGVFANVEDYVYHGTRRYTGIWHLVESGRVEEAKVRVDSDEAMLDARLYGPWEHFIQPLREAILRFRQEHGLL